MKTISATEANRQFSRLLREVRSGEDVTILSRGIPVAKITAVNSAVVERKRMKTLLLSRLKSRKASGTRDWTRNELYGDV